MMRNAYRRFVPLVGDLLTLIYCRRYEVVARERVPESGGVIVVSNHLNNADPPMFQRALPRYVVFMAKKEMLDAPLVGPLFRAWGAFPVRRGEADLGTLRTACPPKGRGVSWRLRCLASDCWPVIAPPDHH